MAYSWEKLEAMIDFLGAPKSLHVVKIVQCAKGKDVQAFLTECSVEMFIFCLFFKRSGTEFVKWGQ